MQLLPRDILTAIRPFYATEDVLVIHGARQVGKTSLMRLMMDEMAADDHPVYFIDLEEMAMFHLLDEGPAALMRYLQERGVLKEERLFLFVDEIQYLSNPSNFLKLMRDHYADRVKLFVSGSSSFELKSKFKDSLTGRTINFELFPLSFKEYLRFQDSPLDLEHSVASSPLLKELSDHFTKFVIYGGYPRLALEREVVKREAYLSQVINTYIRKDIRDLGNIRDIHKFNKLLEVLADQCGQLLNVDEIANTARLSRGTVNHYLFLLEATYVIHRLRPFSRNLRSELTKMPKVFFLDNGIANLLKYKRFPLKLGNGMLENALFSEFRKTLKDGQLFFWRTHQGREIDFIIRKGDRLIPVEVKTSGARVNRTAFRTFSAAYHPEREVCATLEKPARVPEGMEMLYPWEAVYGMMS